ncbi:hypothetical protein ABK040_015222 [Willaertia magna]
MSQIPNNNTILNTTATTIVNDHLLLNQIDQQQRNNLLQVVSSSPNNSTSNSSNSSFLSNSPLSDEISLNNVPLSSPIHHSPTTTTVTTATTTISGGDVDYNKKSVNLSEVIVNSPTIATNTTTAITNITSTVKENKISTLNNNNKTAAAITTTTEKEVKKKKKKQQTKQLNKTSNKNKKKNHLKRKIISFIKNINHLLNNQCSQITFSILFIILVLIITLPFAFFEGIRRTNLNDQNICHSILIPLQTLINRNSAWVNYFATTPSFGETFCNYTKLQHCKLNGFNNCAENYPYNLKDATMTINTYLQFAKAYNATVSNIRVINHDGREMIRIDNKDLGKGYFEPLRVTQLQNKATTTFYGDYLAGKSVNGSYATIVQLNKEDGALVIPYTPVTRIQRTILCDLREDEFYLFKSNNDSKIVIASDGSKMMRSGFVIINLKMSTIFNSAHEIAKNNNIMMINDRGQYLFHNQNSSKEFMQDINNSYINASLFTREDYNNDTLNHIIKHQLDELPLTYGTNTLFYSAINTTSETLFVVISRDLQFVFYNGFYIIIVGLFGIFFVVTMSTLFALIKRNNVENVLITKQNLIIALNNQMKMSSDIRDNYEKIYYSLIPEDLMIKLKQYQKQKIINNICDNNNFIEKDQLFEMKKNTVAISLQVDFNPSKIRCKLSSDKFLQYFAKVTEILKKIAKFHGFNQTNVNSKKFIFLKSMSNEEEEDVDIQSSSEAATTFNSTKKFSKSGSVANTTTTTTTTSGSTSSLEITGNAYDYLLSTVQFIMTIHYLFNSNNNYSIYLDDHKINLPKITIAMHVGNCYVGISKADQIPCLYAYGELMDRLVDMSDQFGSGNHDCCWKNIYISEFVFTKLQIAFSILSDYCKLASQKGINTTINTQVKLRSLELLGINNNLNGTNNATVNSVSSPISLFGSGHSSTSLFGSSHSPIVVSNNNNEKGASMCIPKTSLANRKDFILYTVQPYCGEEGGGLDEIRRKTPEVFNNYFIPKDLEDKLIQN